MNRNRNHEDNQLLEHYANNCLKLKTQGSDCTLQLAELLDQAKQKLKKKHWKTFLKDLRVNLKPTQARKLIVVSGFCKARVQSTELFQNQGIEKAYILANIENIERQNQLTKLLLESPLSTRDLKKLIQIIELNGIDVEQAFQQLQEIKQQPKNIKQKAQTVETTNLSKEFEKLKHEYEALKKRLELSEKELLEYKQNSLKTSPVSPLQIKAKKESDHEQPSLFSAAS